MTDKHFPWWLKGEHKKIAEALIDIDFCYSGREENFCLSKIVCNCKGWRIGTEDGYIFIDASYDGALFSRCLEIEEGFDTNEKYFDQVLKQVKKTIRQAAKDYDKSAIKHEQLSLIMNNSIQDTIVIAIDGFLQEHGYDGYLYCPDEWDLIEIRCHEHNPSSCYYALIEFHDKRTALYEIDCVDTTDQTTEHPVKVGDSGLDFDNKISVIIFSRPCSYYFQDLGIELCDRTDCKSYQCQSCPDRRIDDE